MRVRVPVERKTTRRARRSRRGLLTVSLFPFSPLLSRGGFFPSITLPLSLSLWRSFNLGERHSERSFNLGERASERAHEGRGQEGTEEWERGREREETDDPRSFSSTIPFRASPRPFLQEEEGEKTDFLTDS